MPARVPWALTSFPETFRILRFVRSILHHKYIISIPLYGVYTHLLHSREQWAWVLLAPYW